jgi:hypothetical protein
MTSIAYEKGYFFLRTCEAAVGRASFDRFLRTYFDAHAFRSLSTEEFVAYLRSNLAGAGAELEERLAIDAWVYGPGLPPGSVRPISTAFARVDQEAESFAAGAPARSLRTEGWSSHQWLRFLRRLALPLDETKMADLDDAFALTQTRNCEVLSEWLHLAVTSSYSRADARLEEFLLRVGRLKLIKPIYGALAAASEAGRTRALEIYRRARPGYHPITAHAIDKVLR